MRSKADAHHALMQFIHEVGVLKNLLMDQVQEEMRGEWGHIVKKYRIWQKTTEANSPWQNHAEAEICELKKLTRRALGYNSTLSEFWCFAMEWAARIRSFTAHESLILGSRTPEERITGATPDIFEFIHFTRSQWVWYKEPTSFPEADVRLGRWLGVAGDVGQAMTYWVLTNKKTVIARSSVASLSEMDLWNPTIHEQFSDFNNKCFTSRSGMSSQDIEIFPEVAKEIDEDLIYNNQDEGDFTTEEFDEYLSAQVILPVGEEMRRGQVTRRMRDHNGRPIGRRNPNPLMDTREYEVVFPDGSLGSYMANIIAENIYSQVNEEGNNFALLSEIIDHEQDISITKR
jgi:hypothetical protein